MSESRGRSADEVLALLKVGAAATLGGSAAVAVRWVVDGFTLTRTPVMLALVLAAVVFCVMAVAGMQSAAREQRPARPRAVVGTPGPPFGPGPGGPLPAWPGPPTPPSSRPSPPLLPSPPPSPLRSVPRPEPVHTWHLDAADRAVAIAGTAAPADRPLEPEDDAGPARVEPLEVAGRVGVGGRRIVQCPRCADFRVDAVPAGPAFGFDCRRCAHRWEWRPGTPWPATVVRPVLDRPTTGSV